jgi:pullulanase/glycogen debranching enzyme
VSLPDVWPGSAARLGAHWDRTGTNFAVFSVPATSVWLCLFDDADDEERIELTEVDLSSGTDTCPGSGPGNATPTKRHELERGSRVACAVWADSAFRG